jgi:hypothetical protein
MTFDEQVAALRGKVCAKKFGGKKGDATVEQWAMHLAYAAEWRASNLDSVNARGRRYHASRGESEAHRKWREANRDHLSAASRAWREGNRSRVADYRKLHYARTRGEVWIRRRGRLASSVQFRVAERLRSRLHKAASRGAKSGSAVRDLGCSVADLKAHLERQFLPGMTWDNWGVGQGKWQIDHIYPLAQADLTVRLVVLAVCNWRNLQPLWFEDNIRKGDTVTPEAQQLFDGLVSEFTDNEGGA